MPEVRKLHCRTATSWSLQPSSVVLEWQSYMNVSRMLRVLPLSWPGSPRYCTSQGAGSPLLEAELVQPVEHLTADNAEQQQAIDLLQLQLSIDLIAAVKAEQQPKIDSLGTDNKGGPRCAVGPR